MLRRNWFHVLAALAGGDLHGSAIADDVFARSEGSLRLWPATLYRALDELVEAGMVRELAGPERPDDPDRRKRYYRLTAEGREAVRSEAARMEEMARAVRTRLGGRA